MSESIPVDCGGTKNRNSDGNADGEGDAISHDGTHGTQLIREELPFLVTHWLANFEKNGRSGNEQARECERLAMAKIRRATSEIASAFASLGAYGTTLRVSEILLSVGFGRIPSPLFAILTLILWLCIGIRVQFLFSLCASSSGLLFATQT